MKRLLAAFAIALALPFPGPHVDGWLPLIAVVLNRHARDAPPAFWGLFAGLLAVYTLIAWSVLWLLGRLTRTKR